MMKRRIYVSKDMWRTATETVQAEVVSDKLTVANLPNALDVAPISVWFLAMTVPVYKDCPSDPTCFETDHTALTEEGMYDPTMLFVRTNMSGDQLYSSIVMRLFDQAVIDILRTYITESCDERQVALALLVVLLGPVKLRLVMKEAIKNGFDLTVMTASLHQLLEQDIPLSPLAKFHLSMLLTI